MSDTVIRVENLGKKYTIGHQKRERYTALRDVLADGAKSFGRQMLKPFDKRMPDPTVEEFWALKDVSFEIKQGDRVGIIGRNGAGKSTLLKILSRITEPTKGRISIKGRVASLLEVGTGFHPELTGRENIYLNGAILGMSKGEIRKKFDEIVAFAEVEKFLNTPVKRYSSGMYVRLAFAVAAHLQTDILLVDEVLAVGDADFQKKCLGKMQDISHNGKTVVFVSHDLTSISRLCLHGLVLTSGHTREFKNIELAINHYRSDGAKEKKIQEQKSQSGIYISEAWLSETEIYLSQPAILWAHLIINSNQSIRLSLDWRFYDQLHRSVGYGSSKILQDNFLQIEEGENHVELGFNLPSLATGSYSVEFDLCIPWSECFFRSTHPLEFSVARCSPFGGSLDFKQEWGYGAVPIQGLVMNKIKTTMK